MGESFPAAAVRLIGFAVLAGMAMGILAAMVLLGPYAALKQDRYLRDCERLRVREAGETIAAMDRFIAKAPSDEVLTKRLAWSKLGMVPPGEARVLDMEPPGQPTRRPGALSPIRHHADPPPNGRLVALAAKLQQPAHRRGLGALACSMFIAAMLLFAPRKHS